MTVSPPGSRLKNGSAHDEARKMIIADAFYRSKYVLDYGFSATIFAPHDTLHRAVSLNCVLSASNLELRARRKPVAS